MAHIPFVSGSWKEGRVWDAWMIVHFLSGMVIGFANTFLELPWVVLFGIGVFGMILWEIIEIAGNVHEVAENRLLDVALGVLGLFIASEIVLANVSAIEAETLFYGSALLLAIFCYFGWEAYRKRLGA
jgi:uncharacterized membrane protein AbrB (regulator of aidB expression)